MVSRFEKVKFKSLIMTLLLFDLPLLMMNEYHIIRSLVLVSIYQMIIVYFVLHYFKDLEETKRDLYLKYQIIVSLFGIVIAYLGGVNYELSALSSYQQLYLEFLRSNEIFRGLFFVVIYLIEDVSICGLGYFIHMSFETLHKHSVI